MPKSSPGLFVLALAIAPIVSPAQVAAPDSAFRQDRILIKPKRGPGDTALKSFHEARKAEVLRVPPQDGGVQVVRVPAGEAVRSVIASYERSGLVEYAEPDYWLGLAAVTPDDPAYLDGILWALNNTGQNGGVADADIDAPEGWEVATVASNVVVAVIDTGVRYTHEDLAANMWINPRDGSHGFNALADSNDPNDDNGHGSHIAGVLGALGHNAKGVVGVAWQVQIMACKFADNSGGSISDAIACMDYARTNGASIINASWGFYEMCLSLSNAIYEARTAGIIVVAAAGNDAVDTDFRPYYPASFDFDNIIAVAATTRGDDLYELSNTGATNVDLAAPGHDIYSTSVLSDSAYAFDQGTSVAAGYVSGACALLRARFPDENARQIIERLLTGTDPLPGLAGRCVSGGRLNLRKALGQPGTIRPRLKPMWSASAGAFELLVSGERNRSYIIEATTNLTYWTGVSTNTAGDDGTFVFTDNHSPAHAHRFYRGVLDP